MKRPYDDVFEQVAKALKDAVMKELRENWFLEDEPEITMQLEANGEFWVEFLLYPDKTGIPVRYRYFLYPDGTLSTAKV